MSLPAFRQVKHTGQGYFVTGTDTGIGKTAVTAAVGHTLQERGMTIGLMKPIETGIQQSQQQPSDAQRFLSISRGQSFESVTQFQYPDPLAPLAAARVHAAHNFVNLSRIQAAYHCLSQDYDYILVEGVGGVMVPLTQTQSVRDLIQALRIPSIVVGRTTIGGVNHLQLTLKSLRSRKIPIVGIILNDGAYDQTSEEQLLQRQSTINLIRELSGLPVFGPVVYEAELSDQWDVGISKLAQQEPIQQLTDLLMTEMRT